MTSPFEVDFEAIRALPADRQREELARVALLKRYVEENPLWGYVPHEGQFGATGHGSRGQVEFHQQSTRGTFCAAVVAGNRFGKTHCGMADALIQTLADEFVPTWLREYRRRPYRGDFRCRVVVVDLPNALTKVMLPKLRKMVPPAALWKGDFAKAWNERTRMLQFADGSWWDFLTHDMDVDAFAGADVDRVWFDEEPPGEKGRLQFDESLARLIDRDGDVRFTLTPLLGLNWVFHELTEDGTPRQDDEVYVVTGDMRHNPTLSKAMQERLVRRWEKEPLKLAARMQGSFVHFAGRIYEEFREDKHVIPARPVPRLHTKAKAQVPVYAAIDPGLDHPTGVVFAWLTHEDVLEVFHAFKHRGTVADVATLFHAACDQFGVKPRWTVIDPSARNKSHLTGRSIQHEYMEHGIVTMPGQNDRLAGYNRVKERLTSERLFLHAGLDELVEEFREYRWKPRKGQSEDAAKQEPVKIKDDMLDALRYLVMSMPVKGRRPEDEDDATFTQRLVREDLERIRGRRRVRVGSLAA